MRRLSLMALLLLTSCEDRRSFEERYRDTNKLIAEKESALSENLSTNTGGEQTSARPDGK